VYSENVGYVVKSAETSFVYSLFVHIIHVFRMPLFFFLSGYFSSMILDKKGGNFFLDSRLKRIALPALIGILLFSTVEGYLLYIQKKGIISYLKFYPYFFKRENFTFSHIWFLYYLLIYSFGLLLIKKAIKEKFKVPSISGPRLLDTALFYTVKSIPFTLWTFITLFVVNLFFTKEDQFLTVSPFHFFYYAMFYLIGSRIYTRQILDLVIPTGKEIGWRALWVAFSFGIYLHLEEIDPYWMGIRYELLSMIYRLIHLYLESSLAWNLILILCALAKRFLQFNNKWTEYLLDSGLVIYLVHHPISLVSAYILSETILPRDLRFTIQLSIVLSLSFFTYIVIDKSHFLRMMFGLKDNRTPKVKEKLSLLNS
jgi:glucan biosynthesis protein C